MVIAQPGHGGIDDSDDTSFGQGSLIGGEFFQGPIEPVEDVIDLVPDVDPSSTIGIIGTNPAHIGAGFIDEHSEEVEEVAEDVGDVLGDVGAGAGDVAGGVGDVLGDVAGGAGDVIGDVGDALIPSWVRWAFGGVILLAVIYILGQLFNVNVGE